MPLDTKALEDGALDTRGFLSMAELVTDERQRILYHSLNQWERGFIFFYFGSADSIQHVFWKDFLKDRLADQGASSLPEPIVSVYQRMDTVLAGVLKRLEAEPSTQLVVLSDHGFDDFRQAVHLNRILVELGYMKLKNGSDGNDSLFKNVDWSQTKAYACGFSGVYLNVQGRESQGAVAPEQVSSVLNSLQRDLLAYKEPVTGESPFLEVVPAGSIYQGECIANAPDLIVGCRPGYRFSWQTALGTVPLVPFEENKKQWRGDHIFAASAVPGVLLSRKPLPETLNNIQAVGKYVLSYFLSSTSADR